MTRGDLGHTAEAGALQRPRLLLLDPDAAEVAAPGAVRAVHAQRHLDEAAAAVDHRQVLVQPDQTVLPDHQPPVFGGRHPHVAPALDVELHAGEGVGQDTALQPGQFHISSPGERKSTVASSRARADGVCGEGAGRGQRFSVTLVAGLALIHVRVVEVAVAAHA